MSLHRLEVFVCVAKNLHVTRAARELHISQPSVSRHLKLLEEEFGLALYRKLGHGVELTPEGEEFLKGAQSVLDQYGQLKEAFTHSHPRSERQYLKIGSTFAASIALLRAPLTAFSRSHPQVGIVTKSGISEEMEQLVLGGEIELGFITKRGNLDSLIYEHCGTGEVVPFVSAKHLLAEKKALTVNDLRNTPLVVRTRTGENPTRSWQRLQALATEGAPLTIAMDCDSHRTLRHAVKSGKGLGFSYREYLAGEIKRGEIKVLKVEGFENRYDNFVIYDKARPLSEAAEKFLALVRRRHGKGRRPAESLPASE